MLNEITFQSDTKHRKSWFTGISFSHPAKLSLPLQLYLIDRYTKEGETILDPMAGSGTLMVACSMGRNVVLVELESKFCEMMKGNWEKVRQRGAQLGSTMGTCQIIQGDARNLPSTLLRINEGLLVDKCIFSPPYGITDESQSHMTNPLRANPNHPDYRPSWKRKFAEGYAQTRRSYNEDNPDNIGNLSYGQIDKIVTSPPYEGSVNVPDSKPEARAERLKKAGYDPKDYQGGTGRNLQQDWSYHPKVDSIITSPPYEGSVSDNKESPLAGGNEKKYGRWKKGTAKKVSYTQDGEPCKVDAILTSPPYEGALTSSSQHGNTGIAADNPKLADTGRYKAENESNIGNLKSDSYLSAMLLVYKSCFAILKPDGLMILVTKNFIRNKQIIRLDLDTIKLVLNCHRMLYCNCETSQLTKLQQKDNLLDMPKANNQHGNFLCASQTTSSYEASHTRNESQDKSQTSITDNHRSDQAKVKRERQTSLGEQKVKTQSLPDLWNGNRPQSQAMSELLFSNTGVQGQDKQSSYREGNSVGQGGEQSQLEGGDNTSRPQEINQQSMATDTKENNRERQPHLPDVREDREGSSRDNHLDTRETGLQRQQFSNSLHEMPHQNTHSTKEAEAVICSYCGKPKVPQGKTIDDIGFTLKERLARRLTQQSFWRIIYAQRFPDAPQITHEDILVFAKRNLNETP